MSKKTAVFVSIWILVTLWGVRIDNNKPEDKPMWPAAPYALAFGWIPALVASRLV
jgi:hypothetical protein